MRTSPAAFPVSSSGPEMENNTTDDTVMPAEQFDALVERLDEADPAPKLAEVAARGRRFERTPPPGIDSAGRVAVIADGPYVGSRSPVDANHVGPWSPTLCMKDAGGEMEHHVHGESGTYVHAGTCVSVGHKLTNWCEHTWYDDTIHEGRHECVQADDHKVHVCRCGTEEEVGDE